MSVMSGWGIVFALLLSALLPLVVKPLLRRLQVIDVPVGRSSHVVPTLRGGGIAPAVALTVACPFIASGLDGSPAMLVGVVTIAAAAFAALGFVDDLRHLSAGIRAAVQVLLGLLTCGFLVVVAGGPTWLFVLGPLAVAGYVNVTNFMDGVNTVSGLHGGVAGFSFAVVGIFAGVPWLMASGACVGVAFLAFVPWNVLGSGMFLGDVGSYLLGAVVSLNAVAAVAVGVPLVAVVGPLVPYLVDTSTTLARRVAKGERWHEAHATHIYQKLARRHGHLSSSLAVTLASICSAAAGMLAVVIPGGWIAALVGMSVVGFVYALLPRLDERFVTRKAPSLHV